MGSRLGGADDDVISDINITPFVDIILVVLIIFMVTATRLQTIPVNLPEAASGESTESTSLGITLRADGALLLDGEETDAEGLVKAIAEAKRASTDVVCLIAADKEVTHGRVVWLIDLVKTNGVAKFALNIDKTDVVGPDPGAGAAQP